jgi:hypothetical protein
MSLEVYHAALSMHNFRKEISRRELQRRFLPGSFIIDSYDDVMYFIVGWVPIEATYNRYGEIKNPKSWKIMLMHNELILFVHWENIRHTKWLTLEERELLL